jgi:hypothetical protein
MEGRFPVEKAAPRAICLAVRKGKRGHCPHNKTSRDSLSHGTLVDQSSPENCSTSDYGPMCSEAMAPMGIV